MSQPEKVFTPCTNCNGTGLVSYARSHGRSGGRCYACDGTKGTWRTPNHQARLDHQRAARAETRAARDRAKWCPDPEPHTIGDTPAWMLE